MDILKTRSAAAACVASVLTLGCGEVDSSDLRTSGMYLNAKVDQYASGTTFEADIRTGSEWGADAVELVPGDTLTASYGDEVFDLNYDSTDGWYRAHTDRTDGGDKAIIAFHRSSGESAPNTSVYIPNAFEIDTPAEGEIVQVVDEAIQLAWSPAESGDTLWWMLYQEDCSVSSFGDSNANDNGAATVDLSHIELDLPTDYTCTATFELERTLYGQIDPAFTEGGTATGHHTQTRQFTIQYPTDW
jgi:hypothetical protein